MQPPCLTLSLIMNIYSSSKATFSRLKLFYSPSFTPFFLPFNQLFRKKSTLSLKAIFLFLPLASLCLTPFSLIHSTFSFQTFSSLYFSSFFLNSSFSILLYSFSYFHSQLSSIHSQLSFLNPSSFSFSYYLS